LASLYESGGSAPGTSGTLCSLQLADNGDADTNVTITTEDLRGGMVMEDVKSANIIAPGCTITFAVDCFVQSTTGPPITAQMFTDWQTFGSPDCWCYARQCYGDVNGTRSGGIALGWWYVGAPDISIMSSAWRVKEPPKGSGILSIPGGICADINHAASGGIALGWWRVGAPDISIMSANWRIKEPPKGSGVPTDCVLNPVAP
jgi:hypothetical protein